MKYICEACVFNEILKSELRENTVAGNCSYCNSKNTPVMNSSTLVAFAGKRLLNSLYSIEQATSYEQAIFFECSCDDLPFSDVHEIVENLNIGNDFFANEITDYAVDNSKSIEKLYILNDGFNESNPYESKWSNFVKSTNHKHRFFNKEAKIFLDSLFEVILDGNEIRDEVINEIDNSTKLFRARISNDKSEREQIVGNPSSQLGTVPVWLASEQRMTPSGISALYCSLDRDTCFSEIRAITGDLIISGAFKPTKKLQLLDLSQIHKLSELKLDPFQEGYSDFCNKGAFIKDLMFLMSKPASKNSSLTYLSTQIIFEYLSVKFSDKLSGLLFNSVQTDGKGTNVVLFPMFSTVTSSSLNSQNVQSVSEECYFDFDFDDCKHYSYSIEKGTKKSASQKGNKGSLEFVENSLVISEVKAVITKTEHHKISITDSDSRHIFDEEFKEEFKLMLK